MTKMWTKTSEKLPPMAVKVATWDGQKVRAGYLQYVGINSNDVRGWRLDENGKVEVFENTVTHWAELDWGLPEPPEEEEDV